MAETKLLDFEHALTQLKEVVKNMESDELSLNAAITCYEQGVQLTQQCQSILNSAEQKVKVLMEEKGKEWLNVFSTNDNDS